MAQKSGAPLGDKRTKGRGKTKAKTENSDPIFSTPCLGGGQGALGQPVAVNVADSAAVADWSKTKQYPNWKAAADHLTSHFVGQKDGYCFIPGLLSCTRRGNEHVRELSCMALDSDSGHSLAEIMSSIKGLGLAAAAASTFNHMKDSRTVAVSAFENFRKKNTGATPEQYLIEACGVLPRIAKGAAWDGEAFEERQGNRTVLKRVIRHQPCPRFRIVIPLAAPVRREDFPDAATMGMYWASRVAGLSHLLGLKTDACSRKPAQLYYFPRHPKGGPKPETAIIEGEALDLAAVPDAPDERRPEALRRGDGKAGQAVGGVIGAFNALKPIDELLIDHGYEPHGDRFLAPSSGSGVPGVVVLEPGKVFSHHSEDPLADGHAHDSFDVFRILEHDGDFQAALNAARELIQEDVVEDLNLRHALVTIGGKAFVTDEGVSGFELLTLQAFNAKYANRPVFVRTKTGIKVVSASEFWVKSPRRRDALGIGFYPPPRDCPGGWINLFRGFGIEPADQPAPEKFSAYRRHIEEIICGGDPELFNYVWAWLAHAVQAPGAGKPGVALVLRGGRGTGKGTFTTPLLRIFGPHGMQLNGRSRLAGRFNGHLATQILVVGDEAFWSGDKAAEGVIKGLITEGTLDVERKGVDAIAVDSHCRLILSSNEDWVVPAGHDERRFLVLDVSSSKAGDYEWFKTIHDQMETGGTEALFRFLLDFDHSGVNLRKAPDTQALISQKIATLGSVESYWFTVISEGEFCDSGMLATPEGDDLWPDFVETRRAFEHYVEQAQKLGRHRETQESFSRRIFGKDGLCREARATRRRGGDSGTGRRQGYELPTLQRCRELFEQHIGGAVPWETS